jgi:hypothetical protein
VGGVEDKRSEGRARIESGRTHLGGQTRAALPGRTTVTNQDRKTKIRARMAETGESWTAAQRNAGAQERQDRLRAEWHAFDEVAMQHVGALSAAAVARCPDRTLGQFAADIGISPGALVPTRRAPWTLVWRRDTWPADAEPPPGWSYEQLVEAARDWREQSSRRYDEMFPVEVAAWEVAREKWHTAMDPARQRRRAELEAPGPGALPVADQEDGS